MYLGPDIAIDEELISHCARSNPTRSVLYEFDGGRSVIRLSNDTVIKCGYGVTKEEFINQPRAYDLVYQMVIRVPQAHRFFAYMDIGYIIMEFIHGETVSSKWDAQSCQSIAKALAHFPQIQSDQLGPLSGGLALGLLWIEGDWISSMSSSDIEHYFNARQLQHRQKLNIRGQNFILCRLDIAPRNILRLRDGSLYLLDWASAGFYTQFFEICALRLNVWSQ